MTIVDLLIIGIVAQANIRHATLQSKLGPSFWFENSCIKLNHIVVRNFEPKPNIFSKWKKCMWDEKNQYTRATKKPFKVFKNKILKQKVSELHAIGSLPIYLKILQNHYLWSKGCSWMIFVIFGVNCANVLHGREFVSLSSFITNLLS